MEVMWGDLLGRTFLRPWLLCPTLGGISSLGRILGCDGACCDACPARVSEVVVVRMGPILLSDGRSGRGG